jgi:hypothetical protein
MELSGTAEACVASFPLWSEAFIDFTNLMQAVEPMTVRSHFSHVHAVQEYGSTIP